ncbi:MAG: ABC transporter permease [Gemmatimonadota bacterium]
MENLFRDLKYTLRGLRRSPGFTAVAVLTIALGIGVNSTIFSLVNAVVLRPLPVERPHELVDIYAQTTTSSDHSSISYPNFVSHREATKTLSGLMAFTNFFGSMSLDGRSELVVGELVSEEYFQVLGVQPARGRGFAPEEFQAPGAGPVAILSHSFWQSRFAGDPGVVGSSFRLNGIVYTVVGVAPRGFGGMLPAVTAQLWIPLTMVEEVEPVGNMRGGPIAGAGPTRLDQRGMHFLWVKGRRSPGVEVERVQSELEVVAAGLAAEFPVTNELERVRVLRTNDVLVNPDFDGTIASAALVLLAAVGLVLLVACANLANLMLARASARRQEMAVRLSMGASGARLIRQLLVESLTLALAGGAVALALSYMLVGVIARLQPPLPISIGLDIAPDWRVFVFTLLAALATGALFGLVPAFRASRPDLVPALKGIAEPGRRGRRRPELRDVLVVVQVSMSVVLLVAGGLMVRSLGAAAHVQLGYDPDRIGYLSIPAEMNGYDAAQARGLFEAGVLRLQSHPEVEAVAMASRVPLSINNNGFGIFVDGRQTSNRDAPYRVNGASVDENYLEVMGQTLLAGRGIEAADREESRRVAVVTQTLASRIWPDADAVGQYFRLSWEGNPYQVVGVVSDYKVDTPGESPQPYLHLPLSTTPLYANVLVATRTPAAGLVQAFQQEFRSLDSDLVFLETGTLRGLAEVKLFPIRAGAWLMGAFGLLALVLAAVGLYGVVSYAVNRRFREMGIRKALGASAPQVMGLVLRRGMTLVAVGGVVGVLMAGGLGQALSRVLYVSAFDPVSFGAALAVLGAVAALANWIPARRASRVEAMEALRGE